MTDEATDATIDETLDKVEDSEVDPATARKKLERKLSLRPEKKELVERNILKGMSLSRLLLLTSMA